MGNTIGRYSKYIKPFIFFFDLVVINVLLFLLVINFKNLYMNIFVTISWIVISINIRFYEVYRFTKIVSIINKILKQLMFFAIICYAFFGFYYNGLYTVKILKYSIISIMFVGYFKITTFYLLRKYRKLYGGNNRRVIIIGDNDKTFKLSSLFKKNLEYGCNLLKVFSLAIDKKASIDASLLFAVNYNIDVIYCSLSNLTLNEINQFIDFADDHLKEVKFLPDNEDVFMLNSKIDFYEYLPIISIQKTTLHEPLTKIIKRIFDIFFSLLVVILILSWLLPILAILIKMESNGPAFFKQGRPGIDEKEFFCFKFRSMNINKTTEQEASKNDPRVTRIGKFIRKTSIDEMPQFFNVLLGDMSVVGPRPHLWSQNKAYGGRIKKYMVRHFVKPGITGLAQVKGYRGEIQTDEDMINRINYDVFYIENWSVILDIKIIAHTVLNIFKGDAKAY